MGCAKAHPDLSDQLTLFQPGGTDYAHLITTGKPRFSDLPTALYFGGSDVVNKLFNCIGVGFVDRDFLLIKLFF